MPISVGNAAGRRLGRARERSEGDSEIAGGRLLQCAARARVVRAACHAALSATDIASAQVEP